MKMLRGLFILTVLASGCGQMHSSKVDETFKQTPVIEKTLNSTTENPAENIQDYEPLPTEIKTKSGTLKLGQTAFSDVNYIYDSKTQQIIVTGHLNILNSDKKIISDIDFELFGYQKNQGVVNLNQKNRDADGPVIRAKVTCIGVNQNQDMTCDKAIVDFFVLNKQQFYTDQFETYIVEKVSFLTKETPKIKNDIKPSEIEKNVVTDTKEIGAEDTESEGDEDSLNGRYEGQVQSTDIADFLNTENISEPGATDKISSEQPVAPKKSESSDIKQTAEGHLKIANQAVGFPDQGVLRNATSLKKIEASDKNKKYFSIAQTNNSKFYSTIEMSEVILDLGKFLSTNFDQIQLHVGNISAVRGGHLNPHKSHQIGMDVDLAYPLPTADSDKTTMNPSTQKIFSESYSTEKTYKLLKFSFTQKENPVDRIFVDQSIINNMCKYARQKNEFQSADKLILKKMFENIEHVKGHKNHFHLRLKCTENQPACRSKIYKKINNCPPQT